MRYEETGQFTSEQKRIAKRIKRALADAKEAGLAILVKNNRVNAYLKTDYDGASTDDDADLRYPLRFIDCGKVADSGADDGEYFLNGVITDD